MAQYKVPQDVEADDKLLGPFNFRQFVYLLIAGVCVALAVWLFQVFPILAIIPVPIILFMLALALPLKKDQPMEAYLSALLSFYTKPHTRTWQAGQPENTIRVLAPKVEKESYARDITGEEATHRLSFLADLVDSGGKAIKMGGNTAVREEVKAEMNAVPDIYETTHFDDLGETIMKDEMSRHQDVIKEMKAAIAKSDEAAVLVHSNVDAATSLKFRSSNDEMDVKVEPGLDVEKDVEKSVEKDEEKKQEVSDKNMQTSPKSSIMELADNSDLSVATIAKEANRINKKEEGEVFISLR